MKTNLKHCAKITSTSRMVPKSDKSVFTYKLVSIVIEAKPFFMDHVSQIVYDFKQEQQVKLKRVEEIISDDRKLRNMLEGAFKAEGSAQTQFGCDK